MLYQFNIQRKKKKTKKYKLKKARKQNEAELLFLGFVVAAVWVLNNFTVVVLPVIWMNSKSLNVWRLSNEEKKTTENKNYTC